MKIRIEINEFVLINSDISSSSKSLKSLFHIKEYSFKFHPSLISLL